MLDTERNKRYETPCDVRFLTFSCNRRLPLFESTWAKDIFVSHLAHVRSRLGFQLFAYVVMPDHVHMLIHPEVEIATVRRILSALKTRTSRVILERLRMESSRLITLATSGGGEVRLWQPGGGYDRNIHSRKEFLEKAVYIENNPVRKGLVERAEDYQWSSAGSALVGRDPW